MRALRKRVLAHVSFLIVLMILFAASVKLLTVYAEEQRLLGPASLIPARDFLYDTIYNESWYLRRQIEEDQVERSREMM